MAEGVLELLTSLRRDLSMALLLITHDLGVVGQWADRVLVMYAGRRIEEGVPDAMFERPLHPYTAGLIAAAPRLASQRGRRLYEIPGSIASAFGEGGCGFAPRCPIVRPSCRLGPPSFVAAGPDRWSACVAAADEGGRRVAPLG